MEDNAAVIQRFYEAFQKKDHETMAASYADDARFQDPVFPNLEGWEIGAMWRMLCERGKDLTLEFSDVRADGDSGSSHWEADYSFSATGNMVHNVIDASFTFRDGKILTHTDSFSLHKWAGMALGMKGKLLGWLPLVQNQVRAQGAQGLKLFIKRKKLDPKA